MSTILIGKAALTAIRLTDGRRANIPAGRGVPENIDPDDARRLLDEGFLMEVEVVDQVAEIDPAELEPEGPNPPTTPTAVPRGLTFDDVVAAAEDELERSTQVDVEAEPFTDEQLAEVRKGNVDEQLDAVGDDPVKAQQVLDEEMERDEDKRRKTLLAGLQEVLDAAADEGEEGDGS